MMLPCGRCMMCAAFAIQFKRINSPLGNLKINRNGLIIPTPQSGRRGVFSVINLEFLVLSMSNLHYSR